MPKGPQKSAERGASVRANIVAVVDAVEAKTGSYAFAVAGAEQTLMISGELKAAFRAHEMADILDLAFQLMFTTPATKAALTDKWQESVASFLGRKNTDDILKQKSGIIACYINNHYDIALYALGVLSADGSFAAVDQDTSNKLRQELDESIERELKLEAAASWYRLFDEMAFRHIRQERELFSDYLIDSLSEMLALQGIDPNEIIDRLHQRGTEYAHIKNWFGEPGEEKQSLFWKIGERALSPLGAEGDARRIMNHTVLLFEAFKRAMVREILTGKENSVSGLSAR
jgi:hypothetical protein